MITSRLILSVHIYLQFRISISKFHLRERMNFFCFVICSPFLEMRHLLSEKLSVSMMKRLFKPQFIFFSCILQCLILFFLYSHFPFIISVPRFKARSRPKIFSASSLCPECLFRHRTVIIYIVSKNSEALHMCFHWK